MGVDCVCVCVHFFVFVSKDRDSLLATSWALLVVVVLWASVLGAKDVCVCRCMCMWVGDCKHTSLKAPITVTYKKNKKKIDVYTHMQYIST